jgi:hypothetical protein
VKLSFEGDGNRYAARAPGVSLCEWPTRTGTHIEATLDLHGATAVASVELCVPRRVKRLGRWRVLVVHGRAFSDQARRCGSGRHGSARSASGLVHAFATQRRPTAATARRSCCEVASKGLLALVLFAAVAHATATRSTSGARVAFAPARGAAPRLGGAHARVTFDRTRPCGTRVIGRRDEPLTAEKTPPKQIGCSADRCATA